MLITIFSCLEVGGGRIPEFVTKRGVLFGLDPKRLFAIPVFA